MFVFKGRKFMSRVLGGTLSEYVRLCDITARFVGTIF